MRQQRKWMAGRRGWFFAVVGVGLFIGVAGARAVWGPPASVPHLSDAVWASVPSIEVDPSRAARWPVHVSNPDGPPRVQTGLLDDLGRPVTVSCSSCHANFESNPTRRSADEPPMGFHSGLAYDHGTLSCTSCHNPNDMNSLRLADGTPVVYREVMTMCAQCHAPQARDYAHGAHGGMTGFWSLEHGPQFRKSCIDCHDPHKPAYPMMKPTFKPIDRFLEKPQHHDPHD